MKGFLAAVLLSAPMLANAYTWSESIDFNPNPVFDGVYSSFSYEHDLSDNGFNATTDSIDDYSIKLYLIDKGTNLVDSVVINQPGLLGDSVQALTNWAFASVTTGSSYQGLLQLNSDGTLGITISSLFGSFYLDKSDLVATGKSGAVPEPGSIALLAAGLMGIVMMRRMAARNS
jgi:hypothetical protein